MTKEEVLAARLALLHIGHDVSDAEKAFGTETKANSQLELELHRLRSTAHRVLEILERIEIR